METRRDFSRAMFACFAGRALAFPTVALALDGARRSAIESAFAAAYPVEFQGVTGAGALFRFNGKDFAYDDGRAKTFEETLDSPDVKDMFAQTYPLTNPVDRLPENFDPGRIRCEELFKALFGASEKEVSSNCVPVDFCGHKVRFNRRCGAADALSRVSGDLDKLYETRPELRAYTARLGGTFQWRLIAGTKRLSNHSFATAIDLNVSKAAYWRWQPESALAAFSRKSWPVEIVEAFERHDFIWGGKWWHYDTMHFEFRPELIAFSRANPEAPKPWPSR